MGTGGLTTSRAPEVGIRAGWSMKSEEDGDWFIWNIIFMFLGLGGSPSTAQADHQCPETPWSVSEVLGSLACTVPSSPAEMTGRRTEAQRVASLTSREP